MDTIQFDASAILGNYILAIEYDGQYWMDHEIMVEASAARSEEQKALLQELKDRARVRVELNGNELSVNMHFLSVPKGAEEYAELIKSNTMTTVSLAIEDMVRDIIGLDEVQNKIYEEVKQIVIQQVQNAFGGI